MGGAALSGSVGQPTEPPRLRNALSQAAASVTERESPSPRNFLGKHQNIIIHSAHLNIHHWNIVDFIVDIKLWETSPQRSTASARRRHR